MWDLRNAYTIVLGSLKGRDHLEDLVMDGRIILKMGLWETG
jgi:hypothetical protein